MSLRDGGRLLARENQQGSEDSKLLLGNQRKTKRVWPGDPLVIIDPLDDENNVGRSCWRFGAVQRAFAQLEMTVSRLIVNTGKSIPGRSSQTERVDDFRILNALYRTRIK